MITLGVDLGERRIGFAICDPEEIIASPFGIRKVKKSDDVSAIIAEVVAENNAERVVVGYPRNMNGKPGPKARESEEIVEKLDEIGINAVLYDERMTTQEAERYLKSADLSRKQRRNIVDAVAAQRILESYLTFCHNQT